mgnify:CR=1 FL=1|tara:strand:- start:342 stop:590 length:249 start_codon:yes stop_codon:yes gene_type:complete
MKKINKVISYLFILSLLIACGDSSSKNNKSKVNQCSGSEKANSYNTGRKLKSSRMGRSCSEMYVDYQSLVYDYNCFCKGLND